MNNLQILLSKNQKQKIKFLFRLIIIKLNYFLLLNYLNYTFPKYLFSVFFSSFAINS